MCFFMVMIYTKLIKQVIMYIDMYILLNYVILICIICIKLRCVMCMEEWHTACCKNTKVGTFGKHL